MRLAIIDVITRILVILGGLNWLLVGVFNFDVVTTVFDAGQYPTDDPSAAAQIFYALIGLSAVWQVYVLFREILVPKGKEPAA